VTGAQGLVKTFETRDGCISVVLLVRVVRVVRKATFTRLIQFCVSLIGSGSHPGGSQKTNFAGDSLAASHGQVAPRTEWGAVTVI
jgi:hypothetical protein